MYYLMVYGYIPLHFIKWGLFKCVVSGLRSPQLKGLVELSPLLQGQTRMLCRC